MSATYTNKKRKLEKYIEVVRQDGLNTDQNVNIGVTGTPNLWVAGNLSVGGTTSFTSDVITSTSVNAFAVGANGTTNPVFNIDSSEASVATGLQVEGQAAGSGVNLETLSSGTNESLTLDAKGTGAVTINGAGGTGPVQFGGAASGTNATGLKVTPNSAASGVAVAVVSSGTNESLTLDAKGSGNILISTVSTGYTQIKNQVSITSNNANAFLVQAGLFDGKAVFSVDASVGSVAAGLRIVGAVTGGTVNLAATDSGSNTNISINAKGTGSITLGNVSTGGILLNDPTAVTSTSANALVAGANGATNPVFNVDASTASQVAGLNLKGAATGGTVAVTTTDSGSNTSLSIAAKGTGTITVQPAIATPAAGSAPASLLFGSTASFGIYYGSGAPTVSAAQGSLYLRSDGTTVNNRTYINTNGSTAWTAVTTAG